MLRCVQSSRWSRPVSVAGLALALVAGGCSADVSRFDSPFFGLSEGGTPPPRGKTGTGGGAALGDQVPEPLNGGAGYVPPPDAPRPPAVRTTALPDVVPGSVAPPVAPGRAGPPPAVQRPAPPIARTQAPIAPGQTIDVQAGDTLYGLSRRHSVSVGELTTLNNLTSVNIRPGQKLVLPASAKAVPAPAGGQPIAAPPPAGRAAAVPPPPAAQVPAPAAKLAIAAVPPLADAEGSYTMRPGDSLFQIARTNKVPLADLMRINGISDDRHVRAGTVLRMPGSAAAAKTVAAAVDQPQPQPPVAPPAAAVLPAEPAAPALPTSAGRPTILNGARTQVAAVDPKAVEQPEQPAPTKTDAPAPRGPEVAAAGTTGLGKVGKFRWPVNGRIVSGFGPRSDGTHNDGIDISVPLGTDVLAAEAGTVAYAGNELKGFGNLILVRHDNGFVSAYAHNDSLLVKRGDKVRRGQPLAKAGKTGQIDQPMVHFELRQGSKPVDPAPYMDKM
jgi:murein DD-endopeptidase MepM/ murein hydrolase activator NlpD